VKEYPSYDSMTLRLFFPATLPCWFVFFFEAPRNVFAFFFRRPPSRLRLHNPGVFSTEERYRPNQLRIFFFAQIFFFFFFFLIPYFYATVPLQVTERWLSEPLLFRCRFPPFRSLVFLPFRLADLASSCPPQKTSSRRLSHFFIAVFFRTPCIFPPVADDPNILFTEGSLLSANFSSALSKG